LRHPLHPPSVGIVILHIIVRSYSYTHSSNIICSCILIISSMLLYHVLHLLQMVIIHDQFSCPFEGDMIDVIEIFHVVVRWVEDGLKW
jgi:hypothetical protein